MDSYEKCAHVVKTEEEINKLSAPEGQNYIERLIYLLQNGSQAQKISQLANIRLAAEMEFYCGELFIALKQQLQQDDEILLREIFNALSQLVPMLKKPMGFHQIALNGLLIYRNTNTIDAICNYLNVSGPMDVHELISVESDHKMYCIMKVISVYYPTLDDESKRIARTQLKAAVKHKDEAIRRLLCQILQDERILRDLFSEYDWLDKFSNIFFDSAKDVRKMAIRLLTPMVRFQNEIHQVRLEMLLSSAVEQIESVDFNLVTELWSVLSQPLRDQLIQRVSEMQFTAEGCESLLQNFGLLEFDCDELLIQAVNCLVEEGKLDFLSLLEPLYEKMPSEVHVKVLNALFSNFESNSLAFIPYLKEIISQSGKLKNNKLWIAQLHRLYDYFKKTLPTYEPKGMWTQITLLLDIMPLIVKLVSIEKDYYLFCLKCNFGSQSIKVKIMKYLIDSIPELQMQYLISESIDQREQLIQSQLQITGNYKYRQLAIDFVIFACQKRSRRFFTQHNLVQVLQLVTDPVQQVRVKIPELIYNIKMLFWTDEKDLLIKITQMHQSLLQDKKIIVQQAAKEYLVKLQEIQFHKPELAVKANQINADKEILEAVNCRVQSQQAQRPPKTKTERTNTPTAKQMPKKLLQVPQVSKLRNKSSGKPVHSKSPQPFRVK